jgi:hypothetical protein
MARIALSLLLACAALLGACASIHDNGREWRHMESEQRLHRAPHERQYDGGGFMLPPIPGEGSR